MPVQDILPARPCESAALVSRWCDACFFSEEAALGSPMEGSTDFAQHFEQLGPADHLGRSLRQFDLKTRTFRYPCSYLIYSEQFDALPADAKSYIFRRMWKVLTGRDSSRPFAHLSDSDRDAIYQILLDTKKDFAGVLETALNRPAPDDSPRRHGAHGEDEVRGAFTFEFGLRIRGISCKTAE